MGPSLSPSELNMVSLPCPPPQTWRCKKVAVFIEAKEHTVENTGADELRVILVELK